MIPVTFDQIDDPFFPMDEASCNGGAFTVWGYVEGTEFGARRPVARCRILLRISDAISFTWDATGGTGDLILESIHESDNEVRLTGVIPGELHVTTRGKPHVQFLIDETPYEERRRFRWVSLPQSTSRASRPIW